MPDDSAPIWPLIRPFLTPAYGICRSGFWRIRTIRTVGAGLGGENCLSIQGRVCHPRDSLAPFSHEIEPPSKDFIGRNK